MICHPKLLGLKNTTDSSQKAQSAARKFDSQSGGLLFVPQKVKATEIIFAGDCYLQLPPMHMKYQRIWVRASWGLGLGGCRGRGIYISVYLS